MPLFTQGTWGGLLGPLSQVDVGLTELLSGGRGGSTFNNPNRAVLGASAQSTPPTVNQSVQRQSAAPIGPAYRGPVNNKATGGGNAAAPVNSAPPGSDIIRNDIQQQTDAGNNIIDRDFEQALSELALQEQGLQRQAGLSEQQVRTQGDQAKTSLQEARDTSLTGLSREEQTAQKQASSAMQQARDLYRQMQQQNIAQLSATGLSSSSVAEALAERLGVETARRIAGVTGSRDEVIQNVELERSRINNVFQTKKQQLEESIGLQITQIQQSLLQGLDTINNARSAAAADKANARERLLSSAQSQVAQLQAQAQQFQQQLQEAAAKRTAAVSESLNLLTATPQDFSNLTSNIGAIAPALQGTGLDFGINVNQKGQPTFQFTSPKKEKEDPYGLGLTEEDINGI